MHLPMWHRGRREHVGNNAHAPTFPSRSESSAPTARRHAFCLADTTARFVSRTKPNLVYREMPIAVCEIGIDYVFVYVLIRIANHVGKTLKSPTVLYKAGYEVLRLRNRCEIILYHWNELNRYVKTAAERGCRLFDMIRSRSRCH